MGLGGVRVERGGAGVGNWSRLYLGTMAVEAGRLKK
jgi:hypothetical protein